MKNKLLLLAALVLSVTIFSCKKDKKEDTPEPAPTPAPAADQLFISFTLDGVAKNYTSTTASIHTGYGGGASTSSGFFDLSKDMSVDIHMPKDSIVKADYDSLIGVKIPIGSCGGCPTNASFEIYMNGEDYESSSTYNTLPTNYIKINSVKYHSTVTSFGKQVKQYYITGEFNVKISYGTDVKNAPDGKFGLLFREFRMD